MASPFQIEAWTEYSIGILVLLARIGVRHSQVGRKWEGDDYFAALAIIFFTAELVMLEIIGRSGSITGMSDEVAVTLSPEEIDRIVVGSKCLFAGWFLYTTLIWCLKGCMLCFYSRLTLNLQQRNLVKITGGICILAYIATMLVYVTHCLPLHRLWQVYPYPGDDCALNTSKYLACVVKNIFTDLLILYIPMPLLWTVKLPIRTKILCSFWLCSGIFIIVATLLRCVLSLQNVSRVNLSTIWAIRETFVGIISINLPVLKPFFNKAKQVISSGRSSKGPSGNSGHALPNSHRMTHVERSGKQKTMHTIRSMEDSSDEQVGPDSKSITESQIDLMENGGGPAVTAGRSEYEEEGIQITRTYDVSHSSSKFGV